MSELPIERRYKPEKYKGRLVRFKKYVNPPHLGLKKPVIAYWKDKEPVFNFYGTSNHFDGFKKVDLHRAGRTKSEAFKEAKKEINILSRWE